MKPQQNVQMGMFNIFEEILATIEESTPPDNKNPIGLDASNLFLIHSITTFLKLFNINSSLLSISLINKQF